MRNIVLEICGGVAYNCLYGQACLASFPVALWHWGVFTSSTRAVFSVGLFICWTLYPSLSLRRLSYPILRQQRERERRRVLKEPT